MDFQIGFPIFDDNIGIHMQEINNIIEQAAFYSLEIFADEHIEANRQWARDVEWSDIIRLSH